ncbi:MAG: phosphate ABC transporter ATP-binding protein [Dehalococcoidaceae bacterium]|nr:phosphate ABC transporter ATP-binding protein [Dehalococcoidaceae bacterium]
MLHIEAHNLVRRAGMIPLLKGISLQVESGDSFMLIGPTGAGKTTLLRILGLLDRPVSGNLNILGVDVTGSPDRHLEIRRRMAFVQQKPVAFSCSVFENVAYPLRWRKVSKNEIKSRVLESLGQVDMQDFAGRNARTLSGGETQRIAIARALVTRPEILLLDEPTANLDPNSAGKIEDVLVRVAREHQTTLVMTTHDLAQARRLAGTVGVIMSGELVECGPPQQVFNPPQGSPIARFIGFKLAEQDFNRMI